MSRGNMEMRTSLSINTPSAGVFNGSYYDDDLDSLRLYRCGEGIIEKIFIVAIA